MILLLMCALSAVWLPSLALTKRLPAVSWTQIRPLHPPACWTNWYDRDNPSGTGDWELLSNLHRENPGQICAKPIAIEAKTVDTNTPAALTGQRFHHYSTTTGFVCKNGRKQYCRDYKVRFKCPCPSQLCWTNWYDRDNPSGTGDWELLSNLRRENPGQICAKPVAIEAKTVDTNTPAASTGQRFHHNSPSTGFVCKNGPGQYCRDYKVRFQCPCPQFYI